MAKDTTHGCGCTFSTFYRRDGKESENGAHIFPKVAKAEKNTAGYKPRHGRL